jgi:hypothetical protein
MKLNKDGGIEIYIAAEKPEGVPEENWLPIIRRDESLNLDGGRTKLTNGYIYIIRKSTIIYGA